MSNELGEIYGTVKHGKSCIILDSNTIDVSGNLTTQGHIQFIHSNYQIAGADPNGILTRLDNLDNSLNTLLISDTDASFNNVNITGNVGIGTTTPYEKLHVDGNILASGNITAYSDIRFKKNILTITSPLKKICSMRGIEYTRIESEEKEIGVIAQEVEKIVPELVKITNIKDNNDSSELQNIRSMKYGNCVGLLIEGIKEQQMQIEDLKKKIIKIKKLN